MTDEKVVKPKYNPLQDPNFWIAFVLGGGPAIMVLAASGLMLEAPVLVCMAFAITWMAWVVFRKGGKGSLIVGFLIAAVVAAIGMFLSAQMG